MQARLGTTENTKSNGSLCALFCGVDIFTDVKHLMKSFVVVRGFEWALRHLNFCNCSSQLNL